MTKFYVGVEGGRDTLLNPRLPFSFLETLENTAFHRKTSLIAWDVLRHHKGERKIKMFHLYFHNYAELWNTKNQRQVFFGQNVLCQAFHTKVKVIFKDMSFAVLIYMILLEKMSSACNFIAKEILAQVTFLSDIPKNTFFYRTPPLAASAFINLF